MVQTTHKIIWVLWKLPTEKNTPCFLNMVCMTPITTQYGKLLVTFDEGLAHLVPPEWNPGFPFLKFPHTKFVHSAMLNKGMEGLCAKENVHYVWVNEFHDSWTTFKKGMSVNFFPIVIGMGRMSRGHSMSSLFCSYGTKKLTGFSPLVCGQRQSPTFAHCSIQQELAP